MEAIREQTHIMSIHKYHDDICELTAVGTNQDVTVFRQEILATTNDLGRIPCF